VKSVGVVGAGTMGNGIAHVFAQSGWSVSLTDVSAPLLEKALGTIRGNFERQVKKGAVTAEARDAALARIATGTDLAGLKDADLVVEAATENQQLKFTKRPGSVIGMHFMNPVPVMQLVEVIRGQATSDGTTETVMGIARELGKTPVEVSDYPGFVANRVLMPMINEAVYCLMEGVATAESIDTVMKLGMNHPMGPLALADLIGLDTCLSILDVLHDGLGDDKYRPCPLLKRMVAAGHLGRKTGRGFHSYDK
jgi:3-hydroxybutyryl-CoA dehydrogenase